jgi:hypothetical protein
MHPVFVSVSVSHVRTHGAYLPPRARVNRVHEFNESANAITSNYQKPAVVLAMLSDDLVINPTTRQMGPPNVFGWGPLPRSYSQFLPGIGGVAVAFKRKSPNAATVTVCRMSSQTESGSDSCQDGVDNDW